MVLSNKKLKQKLREALAESLAESLAASVAAGAEPKSKDPANPDPNPQPKSLKELLDSAAPKPRLSKREKRRKTLPLQGSELANTSSNGENCEEKKGVDGDLANKEEEVEKKKKKKEKRKRDEMSSQEEDGAVKTSKKSKKKKKKKKSKKKAKIEEENKGVEQGNGEQEVAQTNNSSQSQVNGDNPTKVYVGGIPYYSTEDDIRSYFESCGTITEVDCMKFPDSGKFRGIAIISFKTEAAAKRALALDGADMGGFLLVIQPYKAIRVSKRSTFTPEIVAGYNRIYCGNLSFDITEDELRKFFSDFKISSIRLGTDKETGDFRGYAHIDFSDSLSVTMALKLDQKIVCGRPIKISCAVPRKSVPTNKEAVKQDDKGADEKAVEEADQGADMEAVEEADIGVSSVSGKIRRKTCYVCGEKGHLSSDCVAPKNGGITPSISVPTEKEADEEAVKEADIGVSSVSGKIRRRTCYECGEKGHLSSACVAPKKGGITPSIPVPTEKEADKEAVKVTDTGVSSVSGKIRRRTCYECGEKGHLSSACPKKQTSAPASAFAS